MPRETELTIQGDIGGVSIAFVEKVGDGDIDGRLDVFAKAIGRQKSKVELSDKLLALQVNARMLKMLPEREIGMLKARAEERARLVASWEATPRPGRRTEFRMSDQQRKGLEQFDQQTEIEKDKLARERRDLERDRPIIEAQISRLRAVIAGRDPTEMVADEAEAA